MHCRDNAARNCRSTRLGRCARLSIFPQIPTSRLDGTRVCCGHAMKHDMNTPAIHDSQDWKRRWIAQLMQTLRNGAITKNVVNARMLVHGCAFRMRLREAVHCSTGEAGRNSRGAQAICLCVQNPLLPMCITIPASVSSRTSASSGACPAGSSENFDRGAAIAKRSTWLLA